MEIGLVGLPSSGKTSLFSALTGHKVEGFSEKPNIGQAEIPDPRVELIAQYVTTRKTVHASLQLVDIPGVPGGDPKKLNSFLSHVRQVDAVCHVVRAADYGGLGAPQPAADINELDTELVLADLAVAEPALDKAARYARGGDADAKARLAVLEQIVPVLEDGRSIRTVEGLNEGERGILKAFGMITAKPMLYVANVGEGDLDGSSPAARAVFDHAEATGGQALAVCAELEAELAELDPADRPEMLQSMGLAEPAIGPLARALNALLGLGYFYTAGEKEVRAWTVPLGVSAPEAAGVIHSDIQRGFIRAECYHVDDLEQCRSEKAIREAGRLRSEGKHYSMQDGDVVHFLFNV